MGEPLHDCASALLVTNICFEDVWRQASEGDGMAGVEQHLCKFASRMMISSLRN